MCFILRTPYKYVIYNLLNTKKKTDFYEFLVSDIIYCKFSKINWWIYDTELCTHGKKKKNFGRCVYNYIFVMHSSLSHVYPVNSWEIRCTRHDIIKLYIVDSDSRRFLQKCTFLCTLAFLDNYIIWIQLLSRFVLKKLRSENSAEYIIFRYKYHNMSVPWWIWVKTCGEACLSILNRVQRPIVGFPLPRPVISR